MKANLTIKQGATFACVFRWESATMVYAPIQTITKAGPARATCTGSHGMPDGWYGWILGCKGMTQINAEEQDITKLRNDQRHKFTLVSPTAVDVNDVNSTNFGTYTSGGVIAYRQPNDLTGFTVRGQLRDSIEATTILLDLAPYLSINNTLKTTTLTIPAAITTAIAWDRAVYDIEMVSAGGTVTRTAWGSATLSKEVTR